MIKIFKKIVRIIIRSLINWHLHFPIVAFYAKKIERVKVNNNIDLKNKPGILAIKSRYFRGDLEILAKSGEFRIYKLPEKLQWFLLRLYWADLDEKDMEDYFLSKNEKVIRIKSNLQNCLAIFIKALCKKMKINCIIGANFNYVQDYDFGKAANRINIPYIIIQRENLVASKGTRETWRQRAKKIGKIDANAIMVYNKYMRDILVSENVFLPEKIHVAGCLRMDDFISKITSPEYNPNKRFSRITLFSFNHHTCIFGLLSGNYFEPGVGLSNFFEHVHYSFARLASKMPEVEFVIKVKKDIGGIDAIKRVLKKNNIYTDSISNLVITETKDPSWLIMNSDVISAFGSTTILESLVARKPVIIPFFDEARYKEYEDYILFKEEFNLLTVAYSQEEYESMLQEYLNNPNNTFKTEYINLFEKYVSPFDVRARERYIEIIKTNISRAKNE